MDPRLKRIVESVKGKMQENPGGEIDSGKLLELEILRSGLKNEFTEDDIFQALRDVGVPEDYHVSWLEDFASWL